MIYSGLLFAGSMAELLPAGQRKEKIFYAPQSNLKTANSIAVVNGIEGRRTGKAIDDKKVHRTLAEQNGAAALIIMCGSLNCLY